MPGPRDCPFVHFDFKGSQTLSNMKFNELSKTLRAKFPHVQGSNAAQGEAAKPTHSKNMNTWIHEYWCYTCLLQESTFSTHSCRSTPRFSLPACQILHRLTSVTYAHTWRSHSLKAGGPWNNYAPADSWKEPIYECWVIQIQRTSFLIITQNTYLNIFIGIYPFMSVLKNWEVFLSLKFPNF